jgi:excisionase family DNA binding protein
VKEVVTMTVQHRRPRGRWVPTEAQRNGAGGADQVVTGHAEPVFLTVQEVADLLRVSPGTIRAWIARGEGPPAMRFGKQIRYRPERVMEWVEEQEGGNR